MTASSVWMSIQSCLTNRNVFKIFNKICNFQLFNYKYRWNGYLMGAFVIRRFPSHWRLNSGPGLFWPYCENTSFHRGRNQRSQVRIYLKQEGSYTSGDASYFFSSFPSRYSYWEIYLHINKILARTPLSFYLGCHDCHQIKPHLLNLLLKNIFLGYYRIVCITTQVLINIRLV